MFARSISEGGSYRRGRDEYPIWREEKASTIQGRADRREKDEPSTDPQIQHVLQYITLLYHEQIRQPSPFVMRRARPGAQKKVSPPKRHGV